MKPSVTALDSALNEAQAVTRRFGTSYYAAMRLFPYDTRRAVYALYGFVRTADEIVDTEERDPERARVNLVAWRSRWQDALATGESTDPILLAAAWVFRTYNIPREYADSFLDAMIADTSTTRYETYAELEQYMYGSAAVIGLMLTQIIGTEHEEAYGYAKNLGYAMQLTNFLRDIREDYEDRGRIYLPQEDLRGFNVTEEMIEQKSMTPEFRALMAFEIDRARTLYEHADKGIALLHRDGRKAVTLSRVLYSKILNRIEDVQYDVFSQRCRTTSFQKLRYALPVLLQR